MYEPTDKTGGFMAGLYACITAMGVVYPVPAEAVPVNAELDRIIGEELARQEIVGAAVGVIQNGKVIHVKGYGHQSLARKRRITNKTVFRWASISKTVTAVAAFQLMERKN